MHDEAPQRIGIFGGTFDPIHIGHLLIAECCREELELAEVRFVLAATAPHKQHVSSAEAKHRWEMLRLAIGGNANFAADDRELRRGGTSYTFETLAELHREFPTTELVFLTGADSLAEFHTWREPTEICRLARVVVVARGGLPAPNMELLRPYLESRDQPANLAEHIVAIPQIELSSTHIRNCISQRRSIRYQVPPAVEAYIAAHNLYRGSI